MHLFVICGHGAGDSGAVGNGFTEAERVRALGRRIKELGGDSVTLADTSRNYYADRGILGLSMPSDWQIVELHMDSGAVGARGGHVIIKAGVGGADQYDKALAGVMASYFPGRAASIVERSDLANPNRAAKMGFAYRLVENGFISNAGDVATFNSRLDDIAAAYLAAFGIGTSWPAPQQQDESPLGDLEWWGPKYTSEMQTQLGTPVDGVVSGQWAPNQQYCPNAGDGWEWSDGGGSLMMAALQRKLGVSDDGLIGPETIRALQRFVGVDADGVMGPVTCTAAGKALLERKFA